MPLISQQTEAAESLDVSARTLRDWSRLPGFPDSSRGYDIAAIQQWRQENERKGSESDSATKKLKLALLAEKVKQASVDTKLANLKLETAEGTLIPRKGVEQTAQIILSSLSEWCDQLPDLIAAQLPKKYQAAVAKDLKRELDKRRVELASELKSLPGDSR